MAYLKVHKELLDEGSARELVKICPFGAIEYKDGSLDINAACKMCKLCVKKGPKGVVEYVEEQTTAVDKSQWNGIAVFVEHEAGKIHPVTLELIGKAKELAKVTKHPVYTLFIGYDVKNNVRKLLEYGVDKVFVYDHPALDKFDILSYANVFEDFINTIKPSSILVGATNVGRSLAPRVAARFRTGLTADCTVLEMKENTDLVQIRPAFGGNIMAQIVTPNNRPQFCTVRYKIFSVPDKVEEPSGTVSMMRVTANMLDEGVVVNEIVEKSKEVDISEADVIVAVGRGVKTQGDMEIIRSFAKELNAQMACTRPLIENGWFDAKRQIGLSGRTVKPKLIVAIGISGAVQFAAGMRNSDCIIAINKDKKAPIFDVANYGFVGDWYDILPSVMDRIKEVR